MKIIGLTGSMGSGKSTVAEMLKQANIPIIDADELARRATALKSYGLQQIVNRFGEKVLLADQSLNRALLGKLVFNDKAALQDLENIVHPAIEALRADLFRELKSQGHEIIVYMAPLLFEKELEGSCDKTLLIVSPKELALSRVKERDGLSEEEIEKRLRHQMSDEEKIAKADEVIINDGTIESLFQKLKEAWKRLCDRELTIDHEFITRKRD
jgi:dephospho-CoA kinase